MTMPAPIFFEDGQDWGQSAVSVPLVSLTPVERAAIFAALEAIYATASGKLLIDKIAAEGRFRLSGQTAGFTNPGAFSQVGSPAISFASFNQAIISAIISAIIMAAV